MPTSEEIADMAEAIASFYKQLIDKSVPGELARKLTRDYFNSWLQWDDNNDDENGEVPDPMWPPANYRWVKD